MKMSIQDHTDVYNCTVFKSEHKKFLYSMIKHMTELYKFIKNFCTSPDFNNM